MQDTATVHILLATYNGEKFLGEQLHSIARQTHNRWTLTVSDDGSTDRTADIVHKFAQETVQPITLLRGPSMGSPTNNFFHLIQHAQVHNPQDLYAFCDQDDIWLDNKLERAVCWHASHSNETVRLYCGRTRIVDEKLALIGLSPGIRRAPSFGNALVQNIASGNTMVMSHAVIKGLQNILPEHSVWHDWTTYLVATALGGRVEFDAEPSLLYRQHDKNVIGSNDGWVAKATTLRSLFSGRYKRWIDANMAAIQDLDGLSTKDALQQYLKFRELRAMREPWRKFNAWRKTSIRRQKASSSLSLVLGLLLNLS